jgi:creatinine amidohydrolase/Fe(II)-dependent formamide hydrolase-like protein
MTDQTTRSPTHDSTEGAGARQRAIEAYEGVRDSASDTLGQAPLLALAGGLAAGALIAALLPRTEAEERAIRPTARRVKGTAKVAFEAAKDTGTQRLDALGLSREKGEETIRNLLDGLTEAAKASANAALEAARNSDKG